MLDPTIPPPMITTSALWPNRLVYPERTNPVAQAQPWHAETLAWNPPVPRIYDPP